MNIIIVLAAAIVLIVMLLKLIKSAVKTLLLVGTIAIIVSFIFGIFVLQDYFDLKNSEKTFLLAKDSRYVAGFMIKEFGGEKTYLTDSDLENTNNISEKRVFVLDSGKIKSDEIITLEGKEHTVTELADSIEDSQGSVIFGMIFDFVSGNNKILYLIREYRNGDIIVLTKTPLFIAAKLL